MHGDALTWFVGKTVESIVLNKKRDEIDFRFVGNFSKRLGVEGDCCSHSWIEHLEMPDDIRGAQIISVTEPELEAHDKHRCDTGEDRHRDGACGHDSLAVYHTQFHTTKGNITLEYRNDSNGYYGGSLVDMGDVPD